MQPRLEERGGMRGAKKDGKGRTIPSLFIFAALTVIPFPSLSFDGTLEGCSIPFLCATSRYERRLRKEGRGRAAIHPPAPLTELSATEDARPKLIIIHHDCLLHTAYWVTASNTTVSRIAMAQVREHCISGNLHLHISFPLGLSSVRLSVHFECPLINVHWARFVQDQV